MDNYGCGGEGVGGGEYSHQYFRVNLSNPIRTCWSKGNFRYSLTVSIVASLRKDARSIGDHHNSSIRFSSSKSFLFGIT